MSAPTVLITGANGFIGSTLVAWFLRMRPDARLLLQVRGGDRDEAWRRLNARLERLGMSAVAIHPTAMLAGDLLDAELWDDPRFREVTHVVHLAASTAFRADPRLRLVNVEGSVRLYDACRRLTRLARIVHVGTAMIAGADPVRVVHEDDHPAAGARHLVDYTATKAEAEQIIDASFADLPLLVARPSIVVGHTALGCRPSGTIFWAFRALNALRLATWDPGGRIDVVPVDHVAAALGHLLFLDAPRHRRYHISAGEGSACPWRRIEQAFADVSTDASPYRQGTYAEIRALRPHYQRLFGPCNPHFVYLGIRRYFAFAALDTVFANQRLLASGMLAPPPFADYLGRCLASSPESIAEQMMADF